MDINQKEKNFNNFLSRLTNDKLKEAWTKASNEKWEG